MMTMTEQEKRQHRCCFTGHRPEKLQCSEAAYRVTLEGEIISHDHHHPEHADVQDSSPGSRTYAGGYRIAGILFHNGGIQPGTAFYAPSVPDAPSTMLCGTSRSRSAFADARVTAQVWRCTVGSKRCAQAGLA